MRARPGFDHVIGAELLCTATEATEAVVSGSTPKR